VEKTPAPMPERLSRPAVVLWLLHLAFPGTVVLFAGSRLVFGPHPGWLIRFGGGVCLAWIVSALAVLRTRRGRKFAGRYAPRLCLCCFSLMLSMMAGELLLRFWCFRSLTVSAGDRDCEALVSAHPTRGWSLMPGRRVLLRCPDYVTHVYTNSKGLRGRERSYRPAPGVRRIVVLGDSFMAAQEVEFEQSLPRLLERGLADRRVEVVNLAVSGYGTAQEYLYLKEEGLKYRPDLVVLAFFPTNDVCNNHRGLESQMWGEDSLKAFARPYAGGEPDSGRLAFSAVDYERAQRWVAQQRQEAIRRNSQETFSRRLLLVKYTKRAVKALHRKTRLVPEFDPNIWLGAFLADFDPASGGRGIPRHTYRQMWQQAWDATERLVIETRDLAERNGAEFLLLVVPDAFQVEDADLAAIKNRYPQLRFDLTAPNRRLAGLGKAHGIPVLDLLDEFRNARRQGNHPLFHQFDDRHWNAAGHRVAARALRNYLDRAGWAADSTSTANRLSRKRSGPRLSRVNQGSSSG